MFEADYTFMQPAWGTAQFEADGPEQVEYLALNYVKDTFDGATDVEVTAIRELSV